MQWTTFLGASLLAIPVLLFPVPAQVSPADRAAREGDASTIYPLGRFNARVQTLHRDLPANTVIRGQAYRRDAIALRGVVPAFRSELEVTLGPAPHDPAAAKTTFAQNRGTNAVTALPRSWVSFPATDRPAIDPAPLFALIVPYLTPVTHAAGTICVDVVVHANDTPSGLDRTFSPELDAHELRSNGSTTQPGFAYGQGCPAPGRTGAMSIATELNRDASGFELVIAIANAVPSTTGRPAKVGFMFGVGPVSRPWAPRPACSEYTSMEVAYWLQGDSSTTGTWNSSFPSIWGLPETFVFYAQSFSLEPIGLAYAFSNGVRVTVPPAAPTPIPAARIAHGDDRASLTGTVSFIVPVMRFL